MDFADATVAFVHLVQFDPVLTAYGLALPQKAHNSSLAHEGGNNPTNYWAIRCRLGKIVQGGCLTVRRRSHASPGGSVFTR